jgi:hypothetical protein
VRALPRSLRRHDRVPRLSLSDNSQEIGEDAAVNVKRVKRYAVADYSSENAQGLDFIEAFTEIKTTWHPIGL